MRILTLVFVALSAGLSGAVGVDFSIDAGPLRRELHSAGLGGQLTGPESAKIDELKPLNLWAARTHDWALTNPGQRILDTHFIFPLLHTDTEDPRNYFFGPTDEILEQTIERLGIRVMYRLGTSIEVVNARLDRSDPAKIVRPGYYNCVEPADWDRYAAALEHIIAHYTEGWANGRRWGRMMEYWELWNEANSDPGQSWVPADGDFDARRSRARFQKFFVHVLKRLKSRFPHLKFGGPAMCYVDEPFIRDTLAACKAEGYVPDFISWHNYGYRPSDMLSTPARLRAICDEYGFTKAELHINEWHYLPYKGFWGDQRPGVWRRQNDPENGLRSVESAVYTLQVIAGLQETCLDHSYFYGCGQDGSWGWGIRNPDESLSKVYHALRLFGTVVGDCDRRVKTLDWNCEDPVQAYGYLSRAGRHRYLLVSRFKGGAPEFSVTVKGLGNARCVSCRVLDRTHDFEEILDPSAKDGPEGHVPFSPTVVRPAFRRKGDTFTFESWSPASAAWLLVFDAGGK